MTNAGRAKRAAESVGGELLADDAWKGVEPGGRRGELIAPQWQVRPPHVAVASPAGSYVRAFLLPGTAWFQVAILTYAPLVV